MIKADRTLVIVRSLLPLMAAGLLMAGAANGGARAQSIHDHHPGMQAGMQAGMQGQMGHDGHSAAGSPSEPGQSAFAAIGEVVALLRADPATDWARVDIEALRQHLIDMDNITLRAVISSEPVDGGARFVVTSPAGEVAASIARMVPAHAATMSGKEGMVMEAGLIEGGAVLQVTGSNPAMIRGLGFIGLMTVGMHHQQHHLALARGQKPHGH